MAQSEKLKQMHAEQVAAAQKMFKAYKKFIVEEFILAFGGSYETAYNLPQDWRIYYAYKPECEEFLIDKTKTFIHAYPSIDRIYQSPVFLKNLTSLIGEYLSLYVAQKGWNRNACTKYLKEILFNKNPHVQLETRRYIKENERAFGLQQKEKRVKHLKHIKEIDKQPVVLQPEQEEKLRRKFLQREIKQRKKELGIQTKTVVYTEEQEEMFQKQKAESHARKLLERKQILTIQISIDGIVK